MDLSHFISRWPLALKAIGQLAASNITRDLDPMIKMPTANPTWFDINEENQPASYSSAAGGKKQRKGQKKEGLGGTGRAPDEDLGNYGSSAESSVTEDVSDQLAVAVLRLQQGLEQAVKRLDSVEDQLMTISSKYETNLKKMEEINKRGANMVDSVHTTRIFMISWPVVVFFCLRALEKRTHAGY